MARRAQAGIHPLWLGVIILLLIGFIGGGYFIFKGLRNPYRTLQALDIETYMENANSLRGNVYKIEGQINNSLAWSPTKGSLFSVEVGEDRVPKVVAILIPSSLNHLNVQKGQRFVFKVEIIQDGVILIQDMVKR